MALYLICVGQKMPTWVKQGYDTYAKRLSGAFQLKLIEIPLNKRGKNADIKRFQQQEGQKMLEAIPHNSWVIALDEKGKQYSSNQFAQQLSSWQQQATHVALLIGGPEGLSPDCLQKAHARLSLSDLTMPHPLVRVMIAEQLYRAWSLLNQHPYHRE